MAALRVDKPGYIKVNICLSFWALFLTNLDKKVNIFGHFLSTFSPECCYVDLVVFEVFQVESFNIKGGESVVVPGRDKITDND